jgi:hypothetical protein
MGVLILVTVTALLLGVPAPAGASDKDLQGLRVLAILAETPNRDAEGDKITKQMLEDQVLVTIRNKAPSLRIDPNAGPFLYINLTYLATSATSYAAFLNVALARPVEVRIGTDLPQQLPSGRVRTVVPVWHTGDIFTGSRSRAVERVRSVLDEQLQQFLAAYYRANP